jgi:hypothetical protein
MHSFREDKDKEVTRERREDGRGGGAKERAGGCQNEREPTTYLRDTVTRG